MSERSRSPSRRPMGTHDVLRPRVGASGKVSSRRSRSSRYRYGFALVDHRRCSKTSASSTAASARIATWRTRRCTSSRTAASAPTRCVPKGTASVVRAFIQHRPTTPWKAWYFTPAFRYERPQAGRYRQHHQFGVEVLGTEDPAVDVEVIALAWRFYEALGLTAISTPDQLHGPRRAVAGRTWNCCEPIWLARRPNYAMSTRRCGMRIHFGYSTARSPGASR